MQIYNTLTRQKEEFVPREKGRVTMYVCGPNLYGPSHVGHALSYIIFDTLKRFLKYRGLQVRHVQNFTDIEDRIIATAQKENQDILAIADRYIARFLREMDALNVQRADAYPRATQVIPTIVKITEGLIEKGFAYSVDGDVYYRVRKNPEYGKLAHRSLDEMQAGARIAVDERKEDPMDFTLWKKSKSGEPSWDSPWSQGRPGWHIECSAMNLEMNGAQIDLHGGGQDVIFPHHENEIAQSEAFTGKKPFAKYWMHNALLRLASATADEKMSRHVEETTFNIQDALGKFQPDAIRLYILSTHYRAPLLWSEEGIRAAETGLERIRAAVRNLSSHPAPEKENALAKIANEARAKFIAAMDDDLGTPQAIAVLYDLTREINRARGEGANAPSLAPAQNVLRELADVLGLTLKDPENKQTDAAPFIELLIQTRNDLRAAKQFALSDKIRDELAKLGVTLEDNAQGTKWKAK